MPERGFWIFSLLFSEFETKLFFSFSAYLIPFLLKIKPEGVLLIFWIFLLFFLEIYCPGQVWTEFGTKIFSLFLSLSHLVLAKSYAGKRFFNFLNFFASFFGIFLPGSSMNGISNQNCFPIFSAYLIPFWLEIILERGILIFWIFLLFFSEVSCPGRV